MRNRWIVVLMAGFLSACGALPSLKGRSVSTACPADDGADTRLARGLQPGVEQHPGLSGVVPLPDALDAFASRMALTPLYQRSIAAGRVSGERFDGLWENVGTPAQLAALNADVRARHDGAPGSRIA